MQTTFQSYCCSILPVLLTWLSLTAGWAQTTQPVVTPSQIDQFITSRMDSAHVPGIAIVRHDKLVYSQGYGLTKADSTQRITPTTIFDAASLSKPVFAYAVLQLVEEKLKKDHT